MVGDFWLSNAGSSEVVTSHCCSPHPPPVSYKFASRLDRSEPFAVQSGSSTKFCIANITRQCRPSTLVRSWSALCLHRSARLKSFFDSVNFQQTIRFQGQDTDMYRICTSSHCCEFLVLATEELPGSADPVLPIPEVQASPRMGNADAGRLTLGKVAKSHNWRVLDLLARGKHGITHPADSALFLSADSALFPGLKPWPSTTTLALWMKMTCVYPFRFHSFLTLEAPTTSVNPSLTFITYSNNSPSY